MRSSAPLVAGGRRASVTLVAFPVFFLVFFLIWQDEMKYTMGIKIAINRLILRLAIT